MEQTVATYKKVNIIFAGIILGIFLYSGIFNPGRSNHPLKSNYTTITGKPSLSTGLSRSFSAIVRLDFKNARLYNPYGISLFAFFLIQFLLRVFFVFQTKHLNATIGISRVITLDTIISCAMFVLFFEPFIKEVLR